MTSDNKLNNTTTYLKTTLKEMNSILIDTITIKLVSYDQLVVN